MMLLDMLGQMQSLQPIEPGLVAHDLWTPEFVESLAKKLGENSTDSVAAVNALASVPTKLARESLKDVLHKDRTKGPQEFAKMETVTTDTPAAGASHSRLAGRNKKDDDGALGGKNASRPRGFGMQNRATPQTKQEVVEFGKGWYDPGSLVVLKMVVPYAERPPEKATHRPAYNSNQRMSAGMEKRMHDKAEKQKAVEASYEWRDAIEKAIRQWDERLAAVAEAPADTAGTGDKPSGDDEKTESGAASTDKAGSSKTSAKKPGPSKTAPVLTTPNPSVAMAFALHPGGTIAKEYHLRWPQDAAATFGSAATAPEPLTVDYVRLQGTGEASKTLSYYQNAITAIKGSKPKITRRRIENGTWFDTIQKDETNHRTRSIDVIVTKEQSDDDTKKSKEVEITVEVLLVEIETPGPEASPGHGKKESPETTSTTPP
jgi:hypothetical protein